MAVKIELKNESETLALGKRLARGMKAGDIVLLEGDLGAGKTCLVRGVVAYFAADEAESVSSPTFALMNIYKTMPVIYHFDMYRLGDGDVRDAGFDEFIFGGGISLIEWPRAAMELLQGEDYSSVLLEYSADGSTRTAEITGALEEFAI